MTEFGFDEDAPRRACVDCEAQWRGPEGCWSCGKVGVMWQLTPPVGWPRLTVPADWSPENPQ